MPSAFRAAGLAALLALAGCATTDGVRQTPDATATRIAALQSVRGAPFDIGVEQISAGGLREKHDELTELVGKNITEALVAQHGLNFTPLGTDLDTGPARAELEEVQALLRAIMLNHAMPFGPAAPPDRADRTPPGYHVGRIDRIANALGGDAVLFIFIRDQYSTGGRKAVMALAVLAGAAAGVAVTPAMGVTASSAALVDRDGTVLWFNQIGAAGLDLRTPGGAAGWVKRLTAGLPPLKREAPITPPAVAPENSAAASPKA